MGKKIHQRKAYYPSPYEYSQLLNSEKAKSMGLKSRPVQDKAMNESKVVRYAYEYESDADTHVSLFESIDGEYVTHADYKALEEEVLELRQGAYEDTETITRLDAELESLKARVRELVEADSLVTVSEGEGHSFEDHTSAFIRFRMAMEALK